jgi:maltooligosyltrehalose trehalohydrolase
MEHRETKYPHRILKRLPVGAEVIPGNGVFFRVWAPEHQQIEVVFEKEGTGLNRSSPHLRLTPENNGYFSGTGPGAHPGIFYRYRLDGRDELYPDPASRFQPQGPLGPSEVIEPGQFKWTDNEWTGMSIEGQVIYEMHIGTFTQEGTFDSASRHLPDLKEMGISVIELMPVADFPGNFGWGYDGVNLFAPTRLYGRPEDLRLFVDRAHANGLGVILDVVYNHLGPVGNYLKQFSRSYFTERYQNEWGEAINFDGEESGPVREYVTANAGYWIDEFHMDGLRLDATQTIFDSSPEHILAAVTRKVRETAGKRKTIIVAENERQQAVLVRPPDKGGYGLDGLWNDDFHHSAMVALTGHNEAYYTDYLGSPQEFISSIKWGYLYQGQYYSWQKSQRGTPCFDLKPSTFILYIQNHDQVANSGCGVRFQFLTSPGLYRTMTALMLLVPETPMLFQGQEFAASNPFFYFSDVSPDLADLIRQSRLKFLSQFRSLAQPEMQADQAVPNERATFEHSKLDHRERRIHIEAYSLHCDLLRLRREEPILHSQRIHGIDGAVIGTQAFVLRFFDDKGDDRLLVVNLGHDLRLEPAPEPLLSPPEGQSWQIQWSSEDPKYGGSGSPPLATENNWRIPGKAALLLKPGNLEQQGKR